MVILSPWRSILFPYTTLFRSAWRDCAVAACPGAVPTTPPCRRTFARKRGDRKGTRLNSSHANIAYAVFRLQQNEHHGQEASAQELWVGRAPPEQQLLGRKERQ